tara:strand:+ start:131 stop:538 length:408 start_codon:yes stop_codon:yes gene_type:complete
VIRPYNLATDYKTLTMMLIEEGINMGDHTFNQNRTHVLVEDGIIKGFFTLKTTIEHGYPALLHFCTKKKYRTMKLARTLTSALVEAIRALKAKRFLINCPTDKKYLQKIISYYFKKTPYAKHDGHQFTLVEVQNG